MAKKIEQHDPKRPPDLAQHYREEIEAVLKDPTTKIEQRHMPAAVHGEEHEWTVRDSGTSAIRTMLNFENWRDGYEFRVQPPGRHVWAPVGESQYSDDLLKVGYSHPTALAASEERSGIRDVHGYIHLELDPVNGFVRVLEYLTPEEMKELVQ